jgi:hypothetical protein
VPGDSRSAGRTAVSWLAFVAAAAAVTVLVVEGPPGSGYGWGSVVVSCILVAVPLVAVGVMVRTGDRRYAWTTVALAALLVFFALMALFGNWSGQSTTNHALDLVSTVLMVVASLGAIVAELPLLRRHAA